MTYYTHRAFAVGWILVGNMLLHYHGVMQVNYYLSMIIMLQTGKYGALFPDVDHNWKNVKEKTAPNYIINRIIKMSGGRHRSWQTHSLDAAVIVMILAYELPASLCESGRIGGINAEVMSMVFMGFGLGWLSHMASDMLTSEGVRILFWRNYKIALVPKSLFGLRFNTGHEWEQFVYRLTKYINIVLGGIAVAIPLLGGFTEILGEIK